MMRSIMRREKTSIWATLSERSSIMVGLMYDATGAAAREFSPVYWSRAMPFMLRWCTAKFLKSLLAIFYVYNMYARSGLIFLFKIT
ncbi:hypothetical protein IMSAGC008_02283 [Muribaculaceae bacterium]|nr:hypothetical protein IMSAGC008_02283 [Muribaculaceae bacterium]